MQIALVMVKADGTRKDFPVKKDRIVIGRTSDCDLRIPLSSVSRQHCELRVEADGVRLRDLGSSNGTFHNSNKVQDVLLAAGDEVGIGPVILTVMIDGQPANLQLKAAPASASGGVPPAPEPVPSDDEDTGPLAEPPTKPASFPGIRPRAVRPAEKPQKIAAHEGEMPKSDDERFTPTVELDDPVAALEALKQAQGTSDDDDLPLLLDDEDDKR